MRGRLSRRKQSAKDEIDIEKVLEEYLKKKEEIECRRKQAEQGANQKRRPSSPLRLFNVWLEKARKSSIGYKPLDKVRLLEIAFLESVPAVIRRRHSAIDKWISSFKNHLCSKLIIKLNDTIYAIRDAESLRILDPEFEPFMLEWLQPKAGEVFLDIGAHIGKHAIAVSKLVGEKGLVVAIEAIPANFAILTKNIELNELRNVVAFNFAAWNSKTTLQFLVGSTSANSNISRYNYGYGAIAVQAEKPDSLLLDKLNLKRIDLIKIDVEGAEYEVMLGLEETISRFKPKLFVEIWSQNMAKVKAFLKQHNYRIVKLSEIGEANSQYYVEVLCVPG